FDSPEEKASVLRDQYNASKKKKSKRPYRNKADKEAAKLLAGLSRTTPSIPANNGNVAAAASMETAAGVVATTTAHASPTRNSTVIATSTATQARNPNVVAASTQTDNNVAALAGQNNGAQQVEGPTPMPLKELARLEGYNVLQIFAPDAIESLKHGFLHDQSIDVVVELLKLQIRRCKEARDMKPNEYSTQINCLTAFEIHLETFLENHSDTIKNVVSGKWKTEKGNLLQFCPLLYDNIGKTMEGSTKLFTRR
ncbi:MAG: hypothetical protein SGILL_010621, partial [Bacillariaceae sp.]